MHETKIYQKSLKKMLSQHYDTHKFVIKTLPQRSTKLQTDYITA